VLIFIVIVYCQMMPHLSIWSGLMLVTCSPGFIIGAEAAIKIFRKYITCNQTVPGVPVVRLVYSALHWISCPKL